MRPRAFALPCLIAVAAAVLPAAGAAAQTPAHAVSVTPAAPRPGDAITVTGTAECGVTSYGIALHQIRADGAVTRVSLAGFGDGGGAYTERAHTIGADTRAGAPAWIVATAVCGDVVLDEVRVDVPVRPHDGTLAVTPRTATPGSRVAVTGRNCWGGSAAVRFGTLTVPVTVNAAARTFAGAFTVPPGRPGRHDLHASCPGSRFSAAALVIRPAKAQQGRGTAPPAAPPARPVRTAPRYNG